MKRLWTSVIILILLLAVCVLGANKTQQISSDMIQTISSAKKAANSGKMDSALKLSEKAIRDWNSWRRILSTYMLHSKLEEISQTLSGLPMLCYYGANDQFTADCNRSITQLAYLNESDFPNLENIF